jgi:serine/threonine protein kinase
VQVKKQLAEGGFGYVFLASDTQTGEACALKKMLCQTREQLEAAKREILYHREFRHPNLLPLLDSAVHTQQQQLQELQPAQGIAVRHTAYLLFPYCKGGSLRDHLNRRLCLDIGTPRAGAGVAMGPEPWPEAVLLRLFRGVLLGVRELHQHKPPLAHRDIKVRPCACVYVPSVSVVLQSGRG